MFTFGFSETKGHGGGGGGGDRLKGQKDDEINYREVRSTTTVKQKEKKKKRKKEKKKKKKEKRKKKKSKNTASSLVFGELLLNLHTNILLFHHNNIYINCIYDLVTLIMRIFNPVSGFVDTPCRSNNGQPE